MDLRIKNLLLQSRKPTNEGRVWGYKKQLPLLTLLHISDVHGDKAGLERLCDFMDEYGEYVEDCICTGDLLEGGWISGFDFWNLNGREKKILTCVGNHDTLLDDKNWDWSKVATQEQTYEMMFAPYIKEWNCVYEENKTYYYKDYPENTIRLIVLNNMLADEELEEQLQWLERVLNDALEKGLHVIAATHYPIRMKKIPCNFSTLDRGDVLGDTQMEVYQEKIHTFTQNGGEFIVWLTGHVHLDYIGYGDDTKQLSVLRKEQRRFACFSQIFRLCFHSGRYFCMHGNEIQITTEKFFSIQHSRQAISG